MKNLNLKRLSILCLWLVSLLLTACAPESLGFNPSSIKPDSNILLTWYAPSRTVQVDGLNPSEWEFEDNEQIEPPLWKKVVGKKSLFPLIKSAYNKEGGTFFRQLNVLPVSKKWPVDLKRFYHKKTKPLTQSPNNYFGNNVSLFKATHDAHYISHLDIKQFGIFENRMQNTYSLKLNMTLYVIESETSNVLGKESLNIEYLLSKKYYEASNLEELIQKIDTVFTEGIHKLLFDLKNTEQADS